MIANRTAEPVETPNIRKFNMSGSGIFHLFDVGTAATGVLWLYYLTAMYPQQYFCDHARPTVRHVAQLVSESVLVLEAASDLVGLVQIIS